MTERLRYLAATVVDPYANEDDYPNILQEALDHILDNAPNLSMVEARALWVQAMRAAEAERNE